MENQELVVQTLLTIQRTASRIAALPPEARAGALDEAHQAYANAMHQLGQDNVAAGRWVETVMTAMRAIIAEIERNGGSRGAG